MNYLAVELLLLTESNTLYLCEHFHGNYIGGPIWGSIQVRIWVLLGFILAWYRVSLELERQVSEAAWTLGRLIVHLQAPVIHYITLHVYSASSFTLHYTFDVLSLSVLFFGGILGVAGMFENWQFAAAAMYPCSSLHLLILYTLIYYNYTYVQKTKKKNSLF